jgi:hypothetical protein
LKVGRLGLASTRVSSIFAPSKDAHASHLALGLLAQISRQALDVANAVFLFGLCAQFRAEGYFDGGAGGRRGLGGAGHGNGGEGRDKKRTHNGKLRVSDGHDRFD